MDFNILQIQWFKAQDIFQASPFISWRGTYFILHDNGSEHLSKLGQKTPIFLT